jgi:hypothetical protein
MNNVIQQINGTDGDRIVAGMSPRQVIDTLRFLKMSGGGMRLDRLQRLAASVNPDLVSNLLTQNITAKLVEAYHSWGDDWRKIVTVGRSEYLDTQVLERVPQLGMIDKMVESGEELNLMSIKDAEEISYSIYPYGTMVEADLRTHRSDRLGYFVDLGDRLGRAVIARLHQSIFIDQLQSSPTLDDSNSLFDNTNHANDLDASNTGIPMTYSNLVAAFRMIDAQTDDNSQPLGAEKAFLITGNYWREIAEQLVENPEKPGTGNRDLNTIRRRMKGVVYSRKLGYDWYLVADPKELPGLQIDFFEGKEDPSVDAERTDSSYQFTHPGRQRWSVWHYYGLVWKYWQAAVRGSRNKLAS